MALPVIDTPRYTATIPSTGKKFTFRTFLVGEEKILMLALESQSQESIVNAIKNIISTCTFQKVDPSSLTTFDLEFMFLKLRSKSVGETVTLKLKCEKCDKPTEVEIDLDSIQVDMTKVPSNKIKLTEKVGVIMKWPTIDVITDLASKSEKEQRDMVYDVIISCIESVYDEKSIHSASDQTKEEMVAFIESLNSEQLGRVQNYIEAMPKLQHQAEFTCAHCKEKNSILVKGLQNFFSSASPTTT